MGLVVTFFSAKSCETGLSDCGHDLPQIWVVTAQGMYRALESPCYVVQKS